MEGLKGFFLESVLGVVRGIVYLFLRARNRGNVKNADSRQSSKHT